MHLNRFDFEFSLILWIASLGVAVYFPPTIFLVIATTLNLVHERYTLYNSGFEFTRRVRESLAEQLANFDERIAKFEKVADDIRESQIKMMGAFRGRGS